MCFRSSTALAAVLLIENVTVIAAQVLTGRTRGVVRIIASPVCMPESALLVERLYISRAVTGLELAVLAAVFRRLQSCIQIDIRPTCPLNIENAVGSVAEEINSRRRGCNDRVNRFIVENKGSGHFRYHGVLCAFSGARPALYSHEEGGGIGLRSPSGAR